MTTNDENDKEQTIARERERENKKTIRSIADMHRYGQVERTLIDNVIKSHRKNPNIKYQKIYDEVTEKLKEINIERLQQGKGELTCCSYQTIMKRVKKRR